MRGLWCTAAEIAALHLPGLPWTQQNVNAFAQRKRWRAAADRAGRPLARRRKGCGGGWEYHESLLPAEAQSALIIRRIKQAGPDIATPPPAPIEGADPTLTTRRALRRDAILALLELWDRFRAGHPQGREIARRQFVTLYRNDTLEGLPDWVVSALTSRAGTPLRLCANTLRAWEIKRNRGQLNALAGHYRSGKGKGLLDRAEDGAVATYIGALVAHQPHLTMDHIRDLVRDRFGNRLTVAGRACRVPSLRSFQRFVKAWKSAHAETLMKMTDPDGFRSKMRVTGRDMNHWVSRPNQLWEIDASPADVLLEDGRHSIYVLVDIHTRRMMASVTKTPKARAALLLLRRAMLAWGVPEQLRTDNGSDFISHAFKRALRGLGIAQDIVPPFSPERKGSIERAIGTLQHGLMPLLPGFIGHNVADRKKIEARKSFAQRLGESDKDAFMVALDRAEMQRYMDDWIERKYAHAAHAGLDGRTPFAVAAASTAPVRRLKDPRALDMLLAPLAGRDGLRTVTRSGIAVDRARFNHAALVPGTRVLVRHDPDDLGRVTVYSADGGEFICVALCPERLGKAPGEAVRALREAQARRVREEVEPLNREIRAMKPRDLIDGILRVAESDHGTLVTLPPRGDDHESTGLSAAEAASTGRRGEVSAAILAEKRTAALFARALEIEAAIDAGLSVAEDDLAWLESYRGTSEYRSRKSMEETFGEKDFITVYA